MGIIVGVGVIILCYLAFAKNKVVKTFGIIGIVVSVLVFSFVWIKLVTPNTFLNQKFFETATGTRLIFWDVSQK